MDYRPKKLLNQVCDAIVSKTIRFVQKKPTSPGLNVIIFFHNKQHPSELGSTAIEAFLTHLAVNQKVAASTQNQALSALLFLYHYVLKTPLDLPIDAVGAKKPERMPKVLTKEEALNVIERLSGTPRLMAKVLYGGGLRLMECLRLCVKDLDFAQRQIIVRDDKGMEDRITMLPERLIIPLQEHLAHVKRIYVQDVA